MSEIARLDSFRCTRCGALWTVGDSPETTHKITAHGRRLVTTPRMFLFLDVEAGLFFAGLAERTEDWPRRRFLQQKSETALDTVRRCMAKMDLSDGDRQKLGVHLSALADAIERISA